MLIHLASVIADRVRSSNLTKSDEGATAVEYGLMVALIAVVIIAAVTALGGNISAMFDGVSGEVATVTP
ncbi:MAG TPA: Flp family type IVb pilin [Actinoplanes sp.]|nr:Flp family type IVb pilin [Actinoplanes sp.]